MKNFLLVCAFFLSSFQSLIASPFIEAAQVALASTVLIHADSRQGSGFILQENGAVMTLYHNVKETKSIQVRLPSGEWTPAKLSIGDLETDVALLTIDAQGLEGLQLETSFQIGEWVLSAGIPFQTEVTVKKGIVACLEKKMEKDYLLVDFPFNPGDFGGPLLNLEGKVIGMQFANTTTHDVFGVIIPSQTLLEVALKWGVFL